MQMKRGWFIIIVLLFNIPVHAQKSLLDPSLPHYKPVPGISGNLNAVGSDTMNNLMTLAGERFQKFYPNVKIQIEGKGSATAPPALISGSAQLGPMSRRMKTSEIQRFTKAMGYAPTRIIVAIDALAVYVNRENPIKGLTFPQIDAIFSRTRKCGYPHDITKWGQLGLTGEWKDKIIRLYGRNSASGTYGYFKEHALCKGDYKDQVKELPGSASVVQSIGTDKYGIGYSGIGYITPQVRAVPLAKKEGRPFIQATPENAINGSYPLARPLQIYINKPPNKDISPLVREFIQFILSYEGQEEIVKAGYIPLPARIAQRELKKLEK